MKLRSFHFIALFFLVGVFFGGLRLHHYLTQPRTPVNEPREWSPLERELGSATQRAGSGHDLLRTALDNPDSVLDAPVDQSAATSTGATDTESMITAAEPDAVEEPVDEPSLADSFISGQASEPPESPAVAGTRRMYDSFASLRRPEVADPDSELNRALRRRMAAMRWPPDRQPPVPYSNKAHRTAAEPATP